jgi:hypothetical protein
MGASVAILGGLRACGISQRTNGWRTVVDALSEALRKGC